VAGEAVVVSSQLLSSWFCMASKRLYFVWSSNFTCMAFFLMSTAPFRGCTCRQRPTRVFFMTMSMPSFSSRVFHVDSGTTILFLKGMSRW